MKKILSILLFNLLLVGGLCAASQIRFNVHLATGCENMGQIATGTSATSPGNYGTSTINYNGDASKCTDFVIKHWHGNKSKPGYIYAKSVDESKYYFVGWSTTNNAADATITANPYCPEGQPTAYACANTSYSGPSNFYAHFAEIKQWDIVLKAVAEGGSYTAQHTVNGVSETHTLTTTSSNVTEPTMNKPEDIVYTLKATSATGYKFLRWKIEYEDGSVVYNNQANTQITFALSGLLSCEFISNQYAQFILLGQNNSYFKLSDAIAAAVTSSTSKVIVLKESGKLFKETETVTYYDASENKYTIPAGITLLIPNSTNAADYVVHMDKLTKAQIGGSSFKQVMYLTVDNEQDFSVSGDICIYAKVTASTGAVKEYGRLHLGNGSHVELNSGARINALGYITGHENSSITAYSGATVQEVMQIADWRGGNALSSIAPSANNHRVFPLSQYYVQNIEAKLIFHYGAIENVTTLLNVSGFDFPVNATLIAPTGGTYTGMFRLGANAMLEKYYDINADRMKYDIKAKEGTTANVYFDQVVLNLSSDETAAMILLKAMGLEEISSAEYILPVNNNMDIHVFSGINIEVQNDVALSAGSTLRIDKGATATTNNASVYVYDAEQHHVQYTDATIEQSTTASNGKVTDTSIRQYWYYNYYGSGSTPINKVTNRPKYPETPTYTNNLFYDRATKDLVDWVNPNAADNKTKLQKNNATFYLNGSFEGTIYTTLGGASIVSDDPTANATLKFVNLAVTTPTVKQIIQKAYNTSAGGDQSQKIVYPTIPINPSATLQNADGSYSAGGAAGEENDKTYTYYPLWKNDDGPKGRWSHVLPQGEITPAALQGNNLTVTIPIVKTGEITFEPKADDTRINSIDASKTTFSGTRFASNGTATFTNGVVTIPIKYTPTTTHNDNITDATPETVTVSFNCHNIVSNRDEVVTLTINLTATQNYAPNFLVNDKTDEEITLTFAATTIGYTSDEQTIIVSPVAENVTDRNYNNGKGFVTWTPTSLAANSPFEVVSTNYFDGAKVVYKPTTTTGSHTQTLTIKATYSNGVEMTKKITLIGEPLLASNPLKFVDDQEIYPSDVINPLFENIGNGTDITFTFNGETESDVVEYVKLANGNYKLQVKNTANIITAQEITIKATQNHNDVTLSGTDEIKVIVTPTVQWNWSKLYFGNTYTNPVKVVNDEAFTMVYNKDCASIPANNFKGDFTNGYSVEVGTGSECTATFTVTHDGYSYTFPSAVYADPRILDVCLRDGNAARTFEDISVEKRNVKFENNAILFATTEATGAAWTMQIIGVPDKMEFIPLGEGKRWTIMEFDGDTWTTTYTEAEIALTEGKTYYTHNLKASTQQIRIICSLGEEQGKIKDLCIYELDASASANVEKLYMPIKKDDQNQVIQTQKNIVLSYVSPESDLWLSIVDQNGNTVSDITLSGDNLVSGKLPKTTVQNLYHEDSLVVSSLHTTEEIVYMQVKNKQNQVMLKMPIRLYLYPQPLPIRTAEWKDENAEKYYFYTNLERTQNVQFNAANQKLTFASSGNAQRFITFEFRGGPSYISFESSLDFVAQDGLTADSLVLQEWYDYWTLEVWDGESYHLIADSAKAEVKPEVTAEVRDGKTYFQLRVAVPYTTKSITLQSKRVAAIEVENIIIDGEADLDVVQGNHTIEHETEVSFTPDMNADQLVVTAINLNQLNVSCNNEHFDVKYGATDITSTPITLTSTECPNALGHYMVGNIVFDITWDGVNVVEEGVIVFTDNNQQVLATVRLLGAKDFILQDNSEHTGLFTGFAKNITSHPFKNDKTKYQYTRHEVNLYNTFDENGVALFDYLIVYGETTADDLGSKITTPTTSKGSNANTPVYIYRKMQNDQGVFDRYQFVYEQANVNQGAKSELHAVLDVDGKKKLPHAEETDGTQYINIAEGEQLRVYMTGFCPYASTGFEKTQEGVWLFRAKKNAKLDLYLEDCHIYSRNKTEDGHTYTGKNDPKANIFQEDYARGSGGVLVFECNQEGEYLAKEAFQVTIHTRDSNLLKSNHGCFYEILGVRAYQVSSPVQIRLTSNIHYESSSKTHLTFDDIWPTEVNANNEITDSIRTNGFLSLQKQNNNAPSIDMGNGNTVVNFRGGQVELQNAQNVSDKYKTTLAISYRSGIMATGGVEVQMAYGIGTDAATKGTVNFYDGTISVIPMYVEPEDRKYYLMDPEITAAGDTVKDAKGQVVFSDTTSCLRCPENTFVYGGSICMLRACMSPTSQGGAPTDGVRPLGRFFYKEEYGYEYNTTNKLQPTDKKDASQWLVNPVKFPSDITLFEGLENYHRNEGKYTYGIKSVTPDANGQLTLWIPDGFGGVEAEQDRYLTTWKACMPEITAVLAEVGITTIGGTVGGPTQVENLEVVSNLLYCQMDEHIYRVISETTGEGENERYVYEAPLKVPEGFSMEGVDLGLGDYLRLAPSNVGKMDEHEMQNKEDYEINNKVYYVASATADVWQTFTAPFDVENIWIVETYDETALKMIEPTESDPLGTTKRSKILTTQANHNADFAAFFGVAMALGSEKSFDEIFEEYIDWAIIEDKHQGDRANYSKRGRDILIPYDGTNWKDANFYLFHNDGNWVIEDKEMGKFTTKWQYVQKQGDVLLKKGETYSLLFPYCVGCWDNGGLETRDFWDYWSGKLIIFESTQAIDGEPHVIRGANYVSSNRPEKGEWIFDNEEVSDAFGEVVVTGNSTLAQMHISRSDVFVYYPTVNDEAFLPMEEDDEQTIFPTTAFLYGYVPKNNEGMPARRVKRTGEIVYDKENTPTDVNPGGNIPTVGGGNDLFITSTVEGINIAVAEPQQVRVMSATGAIIFSGMVQTAVDVALPTTGVYVITGENEVHKILH